jgi:hypothetical protein
MELTVPEATPYMMVSFDLSAQSVADGAIREVNLYLTGQRAHSGRSYKVRADRVELENTYNFMEPKRDIDDVLSLLKSSVFVDYTEERILSQVIVPELFACKRVCVSKKRTCDGIYYSGITVDQLTWFLERFRYPPAIRSFVRRHHDALEHLYFDVGFDYVQGSDGNIVYRKSSYYGTL